MALDCELTSLFRQGQPAYIPNVMGEVIRAELVLSRAESGRCEKIHWWFNTDDAAHDHPWDFEIEILKGGYVEERFSPAGLLSVMRHDKGDKFLVPYDSFHRVIELDAGTVTHMNTGEPRQDDWHFMDMDRWEDKREVVGISQKVIPSNFKEHYDKLNPVRAYKERW